ncbi:solute carrier family 23 protein [Ectobacillus funiculus]
MKRYFQFEELGTNYKREFIAGLTTFLSMAYILFVNPATLSLSSVKGLPAGMGMDPGAVFVATALAAAVGSLIMGIFARYPIALAPGMGINAFFCLYSYLNNGNSLANCHCRYISFWYCIYLVNSYGAS